MSKKSKAKLKKILKNQIIEKQKSELKQEQVDITKEKNAPKVIVQTMESNDLTQISTDLKKTGLIVLILAIIIVVLATYGQSSGALTSAGDFLYKALGLN